MKIEIEKTDEGLLVWKDGKHSGIVTMGEMLEQVLSLLNFTKGPAPLYPMKTPEEWEMSRYK